MRKLWIIGLLACMTLAGCIPLAITNVQVSHDNCDAICIEWQTNQLAQCKVTYCADGLCYTSPLEPEPGMQHCLSLPVLRAAITITAIGRGGQAANYEVKE